MSAENYRIAWCRKPTLLVSKVLSVEKQFSSRVKYTPIILGSFLVSLENTLSL